jgi:hypothetical protein
MFHKTYHLYKFKSSLKYTTCFGQHDHHQVLKICLMRKSLLSLVADVCVCVCCGWCVMLLPVLYMQNMDYRNRTIQEQYQSNQRISKSPAPYEQQCQQELRPSHPRKNSRIRKHVKWTNGVCSVPQIHINTECLKLLQNNYNVKQQIKKTNPLQCITHQWKHSIYMENLH